LSKLTRIVLAALGAVAGLALAHAWLSLGFDPLRAVGLRKGREVVERARFRVGFLPVT
jgi:hypothetical protein